ncbi:unnamed protein product, partial [Meganyctiphanes norvegica]
MNITSFENSNSSSSTPSRIYSAPLDIVPALRLRYQILLPIFIVFGIVANTLTFLVTTRPKLKSLHYNVYIQALSLLDLMGFIMRLPMVFDDEYCGYSDYTMAIYMTHFGWLLVNYLRAISSYVLMFLSFDRFTGIWLPDTFRNIKGTEVGKKRLIPTAIWVFLTAYIPWACFLTAKQNDHHDQWIVSYSISREQVSSTWFWVFKHYSTLAVTGFPSFCILGLNIGIVIGLLMKNYYKRITILGEDRTAKKRFYHTIAVLILNLSYAACCFPYLVTMMYIKRGTCYSKSTYSQETVLCLLESLSSLWSILNMVIFFLLNRDYKIELKSI